MEMTIEHAAAFPVSDAFPVRRVAEEDAFRLRQLKDFQRLFAQLDQPAQSRLTDVAPEISWILSGSKSSRTDARSAAASWVGKKR